MLPVVLMCDSVEFCIGKFFYVFFYNSINIHTFADVNPSLTKRWIFILLVVGVFSAVFKVFVFPDIAFSRT